MQRKRILLIDDDIAAMRMIKLSLERTGRFLVHEESCPANAVPTARRFQPDLILLDIVMPEMDGGAVAACLAADSELRNIPVVFLTSLVSEKEAVQGSLRSGGYQYLAKPVDLTGLAERLELMLAERDFASDGPVMKA
jgi:CheY-like chemotaxis protein